MLYLLVFTQFRAQNGFALFQNYSNDARPFGLAETGRLIDRPAWP